MKARFIITITITLIVALLANGLVQAKGGQPPHEARPEQDTGQHTGDHGRAVSPGKPQRPDYAGNGNYIADNGEPDPQAEPTQEPDPQEPQGPQDDPQETEQSEPCDPCQPVTIVIGCDGVVTVDGVAVTLPYTNTAHNVHVGLVSP